MSSTPFLAVPTFSWPAAPFGLLYSYAAGSTTPKTTYSDAAGLVPNINPIELDSLGSATVRLGEGSYKFVLLDQTNTVTLWEQDNYDVVSATSIISLIYPQTAAELAASVTPTSYTYPTGDVRRYGAVLDGATDCVSALSQACSIGGLVTVSGNMALSSLSLASLTNKAIALNSNTTIQGYAGYTCTVTGTTPCNVFWSINASNIKIVEFACVGNGSSSATSSTGYFWYQQCTAGATGQMGNAYFGRNNLSNFAGIYWIYVDNTAAVTYPYVGFTAENNTFTSLAGNAQTLALTTITTGASIFGFSGSDTVVAFYSVKDVALRNNVAYGTYIKNFSYFWSGCLRCKAHSNILVGFGTDASILTDMGSYALAAYDHAHGAALQPNEIEFYDNTIDSVKDNGIYMANPMTVTVRGNTFQSQTSTGGTIPKGAISYAGGNYLKCTGNHIYSCASGIIITQAPIAGARVDLFDNAIHNIPASGTGLSLSGTTGGNAPDINVDGLRIDTTNASVTAISLNFSATVGCDNLSIQNFAITGAANGIKLFDAGGATVPAFGNIRIGRGSLKGITGNNLQWLNATNAATRAVFENIDFLNMQAGAVGFSITSAVGVTVRNLTFHDMTSGATFCWYGGGAQGRAEGVRFNNVATANRYDAAANRMGVDVPSWTGNDNDFVLDLNPNELGSAASKYTRQGWTWDRVAAAWKEVRCLTGN